MRRSSAAARGKSPAGPRPPAQVREKGLLACSLCVAALLALGTLGCGADGEAPGAAAASTVSSAKHADPSSTKPATSPATNPAAKSAAKSATQSATSPDPRDASAEPKPASAEGAAGRPTAKPERTPSATPGAGDHDDHEGASAPPPAVEPRAEQLQDLETLCAALNRDYVDGTLTDYYHDLTMKTGFGKDLRRRGEESMRPGRILESGRAKLGENAGDPQLPACAQLFDELDDLE